MTETRLRRYTNLAATIHILRNKCLTLLSPALWDDRNDAFYLAKFKERIEARSVLALCFAEAIETYHHWRVFAPGGDGVCIAFDKGKVLEAVNEAGGIIARRVDYKPIEQVNREQITTDDLPFLKRFPYQDEEEFRLLFSSTEIEAEFHNVAIPLDAILSITLSPWMPAVLADPVQATLKGIKGCKEIRMFRSTLVDNERWKNAADPAMRVTTA